jgi:hypothetical protein
MPPASVCRRSGARDGTGSASATPAIFVRFRSNYSLPQRDFQDQTPKLRARGDGPAPCTALKLNTGPGEYRVMSGLLIILIIQIISGAVGGNVAARVAKSIDLGTIGNTIAGAIGGGAGGQILGMLIPMLANSDSTPDIGSIIGQVAGGGVAGAVLTAIVGAVKNRTAA